MKQNIERINTAKELIKRAGKEAISKKRINFINTNTEHQVLAMNKDLTILKFTDAHIRLIYMLEHYHV